MSAGVRGGATRVAIAAALSAGLLACATTEASKHQPASAHLAMGGGMRMSGRFAAVPGRPDCLRFAYGQSALSLRYRGPMPRVLLARGDANSLPILFDVRVDGELVGLRTLLQNGDGDGDNPQLFLRPHHKSGADRRDPEAAAEGRATHRLQLVRRGEALMGEVWACGVALAPGTTLLPPDPPPARRLLFLGDSITAGYGNLGDGPHCPFAPAEENGSLAFAPLAAADLGADLEVVAWSGRGLWRNLDLSQVDTMPQLLGRALPEDRHAHWAAAAAPVDAVVVNLGTNDFSGGPVDGESFTAAYVSLLTKLRGLYPAAHLVATLGPMLQDEAPTLGALSQARTNLRAAIDRRRRAGETPAMLSALEFPRQDGSLGYGCDWHPSLATHRAMALQLAAHLRAAAGL